MIKAATQNHVVFLLKSSPFFLPNYCFFLNLNDSTAMEGEKGTGATVPTGHLERNIMPFLLKKQEIHQELPFLNIMMILFFFCRMRKWGSHCLSIQNHFEKTEIKRRKQGIYVSTWKIMKKEVFAWIIMPAVWRAIMPGSKSR
ncbi:hypothetical protein [Heyndrickxia coagulans]|uniref:hypothetical protein n=1 Tax=Heyndrickxia coagulans TaxID=1398 RepID=UPI002E1E1C70|nr:hypothetical protein [Heyndrickxia coagulans]